jgi:hypothetical protein
MERLMSALKVAAPVTDDGVYRDAGLIEPVPPEPMARRAQERWPLS